MLKTAAKNLRLTSKADFGMGSEIAEIVLYAIMKHHFSALPVVPKIFYKQNAQDNAKGADSVHIVINGQNENDFTLWLGEAKFYSGIENARLDNIVQSVKASLDKDKIRRENSIITSVSDMSMMTELSEKQKDSIQRTLAGSSSLDGVRSKLHIPILIIHQCEITSSTKSLQSAYINDICDFHIERATAYFEKQIASMSELYQYSEITFHIILFPVPSKERVVTTFVDYANFYRGK